MDELQQFKDLLAEQMATKPRLEDYADQGGELVWRSAMQNWLSDLNETQRTITALQNESMGVAELPDGTLVPIDDLSPEEQDYVSQYNTQLYNQVLAKYGLEQYSLRAQSVADANAAMVDEFNAKRQTLSDKMALEDSSLERALGNLDRWMSGQEVAGQDADRIQSARKEMTAYGTSNGKTSFSGNDLGAGVSMLAQQCGIGGDAPLIQYPGFQTWDPVGDRQNSMNSMGLDPFAPPQIPQSVLSFDDIPQLGAMQSAGGAPGGMPPMAPPPNILPPWQPNIDLAAIGQGIGSAVDKSGNAMIHAGVNGGARPTNGLNGLLDKLKAGMAQGTGGGSW